MEKIQYPEIEEICDEILRCYLRETVPPGISVVFSELKAAFEAEGFIFGVTYNGLKIQVFYHLLSDGNILFSENSQDLLTFIYEKYNPYGYYILEKVLIKVRS